MSPRRRRCRGSCPPIRRPVRRSCGPVPSIPGVLVRVGVLVGATVGVFVAVLPAGAVGVLVGVFATVGVLVGVFVGPPAGRCIGGWQRGRVGGGRRRRNFDLACLIAAVTVVAVAVVTRLVIGLDDAIAAGTRTALELQRVRILLAESIRAFDLDDLFSLLRSARGLLARDDRIEEITAAVRQVVGDAGKTRILPRYMFTPKPLGAPSPMLSRVARLLVSAVSFRCAGFGPLTS